MFQKKAVSYDEIKDGFPGQPARASITQEYDSVVVFDNTNKVYPGDFIIGEVDNATKNIKYASLAKGALGSKKILGVVTTNTDRYPAYQDTDPIPNGHCVNYLKRGAVYIKATKDATYGHWVYLKNDDCSLEFDANATKANCTNTGFRVSQGGAKDSIISIESL